MPRDGGIWALGGYLYQIIGVLGIGASVSNLRGNETLDQGNDLDILVQLVNINQSNELQIHPEIFNEDALIRKYGLRANDNAVFIQFKYSAQVPPTTIGPADVNEILNTFDDSVTRASASGLNITACVLITNKRFAQGNGSGGQLWEDKKNNPQRTYQLREIVEYPFDNFINELNRFAERYGATDNEIERGIRCLIGHVIVQAVNRSFPFNTFMETLTEAFTGYRYARPISVSDLKDNCQRQLDEFARNIRIDAWSNQPIPRDILHDLYALIQTRALIGLCGDGGNGKSVLLWQLLTSYPDSVCYICDTIRIRTDWIPYLINHEFRGLPSDKAIEPIEQALERLSVANRNVTKPILWLGLDSLDEVTDPDQKSSLRDIVNWFWEQDKRGAQSVATLITTFRSSDQLTKLLNLSHDYPGRTPEILKLDQFNDKELGVVFQRIFPDIASTVLMAPLDRDSVHNFYPRSQEDDHSVFRSIDPSILVSLYHPVVWRSLLNLSIHIRKGVLQNDNNALDELALDFLRWFKDKLDRIHLLGLNEERLLQLLASIAGCTIYGSWCPNNNWLSPTFDVCDSHRIAIDFLKEAELSGLIESGSDKTWRWKHAFVYNYLSRYHG